jgi:hypothetical protein
MEGHVTPTSQSSIPQSSVQTGAQVTGQDMLGNPVYNNKPNVVNGATIPTNLPSPGSGLANETGINTVPPVYNPNNPTLAAPTYYPDSRGNREFQAVPTTVPNPNDPFGLQHYGLYNPGNDAVIGYHAGVSQQFDSLSNNYGAGMGPQNTPASSKTAQYQLSAIMNTLPASYVNSPSFQTFRQNLQWFTDRNLLSQSQLNEMLTAVENNSSSNVLSGGDWVTQLDTYVQQNNKLPPNFKTDGQTLSALMSQQFSPSVLSGLLYAVTSDASVSADRRQAMMSALGNDFQASQNVVAGSNYKVITVGGKNYFVDYSKPVEPTIANMTEVGKLFGNMNPITDDGQKVQDIPYAITDQVPGSAGASSNMYAQALYTVKNTQAAQPISQWQTSTSPILDGGVQAHNNIVDVLQNLNGTQNYNAMNVDQHNNLALNGVTGGSYGFTQGSQILQSGYDVFDGFQTLSEGSGTSQLLAKAAQNIGAQGGFFAESFGSEAAEFGAEALGFASGAAEVAGVAAAVVGIFEGANELLYDIGVGDRNYVKYGVDWVEGQAATLWQDIKGII